MADEMQEIINDFIVETTELLDGLDQKFVELEKATDSQELLNAIFRSVHTTKGAAGFLGFKQVVDVAHTAEGILNKLRQGSLKAEPAIMDALLKAVDMLKLLLSHIREKDGKEEDISDVLAALQGADAAAPLKSSSVDMPVRCPSAVAQAGTQIDVKVPQPLSPLSGGDEPAPASLSSAPAQKQDKAVGYGKVLPGEPPKMLGEILLERKVITREQMQEVLSEQKGNEKIGDIFIRKGYAKKEDIDAALSTGQGKSIGTLRESTIRVDINRLDNVLNLVGELVLGRNRLMRLADDIETEYGEDDTAISIRQTISNLNVITTDLQLAVMKTRMQPIGRVFGKFPRMVRDLARAKGKDIELVLVGEDTELDKTVIEEIGDPLVHLVRNSVDHGIEASDVRVQKGKTPKGKIVLSAHHQGNNIFIAIEDDGNGIDPVVLREKAVEKGVMDRAEAERLSDKEILSVIFMPGFSTAKEVTDVSGRGVGMDVVKTNISKLNGSIDIDTKIGHRTKITIALPLTLAIIQALMVEAGEEIYALPLSIVMEILKVDADEIKTVDKKEVIYVRNTVFPIVRLSNLLGNSSQVIDRPYIVIIAMADKQVGVMVDALHGQEEIVIKSMGEYLSNIKGIAGATITGSGQVVLILDITAIFSQTGREKAAQSAVVAAQFIGRIPA
ncbi:MAG: chemotaxis protein CheA [Deltaproteobacteria bacterium]|nr:chemotaxis protein CheA [Deltaproteobacteria bacterium]